MDLRLTRKVLAARMFDENKLKVGGGGWIAGPGHGDAGRKVDRLRLGDGHGPVPKVRRTIVAPARLAGPPFAGPTRSGSPGNPEGQGDAVAMPEPPLRQADLC